ncbi:MAG: S8 family serine peptidase [Pseudomonadota bacterium]
MAIISCCAVAASAHAASEVEPRTPQDWLRAAVTHLCVNGPVDGALAQHRLAGAWLLKDERALPRGQQQSAPIDPETAARIDQWFLLPGGHELRARRSQPAGRLRRFSVEFHRLQNGALQPELSALADGGCVVRSARRIISASDTPQRTLVHLDGDLATERWRETLQAAWPAGRDPGGVRVGLIDSGLAYDLPMFASRLARDANGVPLGYDFWDLDAWPYDGDMARGAFLPIRHGTPVASVLVREAPGAALIPLRYPRPDMSRLADAINRAAAVGARIVAMPLGSRRRSDWEAFNTALEARPDVLAIVSAGNDGRDIDIEPVWPAALPLDNMLVVTSADAFGRLARGSNWGAASVDIMLPAENIEVTDFRGAQGKASGSSYAVPRLAALAARLLTAEPALTTPELIQRIFERTAPPADKGVVAAGWLPDPAAD